MVEKTLLSSLVTIAQYRELEACADREGIADFIYKRFSERYIEPLRTDKKHGFCMMAISCLMIEALDSFWNGLPDTDRKSKKAFEDFFKQCQEQGSVLGEFYKQSDDFYLGVRCGILYQAETTNGWRIHRKGFLFEPETKTINATLFHNELEKVLALYRDRLKQSDWKRDIWCNLRKKMQAVIQNCQISQE